MFRRKDASKLERNKHDDKLMELVLAGDAAKVRPLLEKKKYSSLTTPDKFGRIPIVEACSLGYPEIAEMLLNADSDANIPDSEGRTPLHIAAMKGHDRIVSLLLKKGLHVDVRDNKGNTPLHYAASAGNQDVLHALVAHHADTEHKDTNGNTPLLLACKANQRDTAVALMNACANINATNRQQKTALMFACTNGAPDLVQMLLQRGAEVGTRDTSGKTALSYAKINNNTACIDLLPASAPLGRTTPTAGTTAGTVGTAASSASSGNGAGTAGITAAGGMDSEEVGAFLSSRPSASYTKLKEQVETLTVQLAQKTEALQSANATIDELRTQLSAFQGAGEGDTSVVFQNEDSIDLGQDPSSPHTAFSPGQEVRVLKQRIGALVRDKSDLAAKVEELQNAPPPSGDEKDEKIAELQQTITNLKEELDAAHGGMPMVPAIVLDQVRASHNAKVQELEAKLSELSVTSTPNQQQEQQPKQQQQQQKRNGGAMHNHAEEDKEEQTWNRNGQTDDDRVLFYRNCLLQAVQGTLPTDMKEKLLTLAASGQDETPQDNSRSD